MKKFLLPVIRFLFLIITIIGVMLFIVEQITLTMAVPLIWILTGKGMKDVYDISFITWLANNKVFPFFEKIGIDKII